MTSAQSAWRRALMAVGLSAAVVLGGATFASADIEDEPGYAPSQEPLLSLEVLNPICDGDVPYLQYDVDVEGVEPPPTSVRITFLNPGGENYVLEDQPLSGRVLWPGAEVDGAGNPLDWPGWSLVDGEWVVGDEWDWVRPSVSVLFEVNPEATATVAYPPSSPNCATNPPGETPPPGDESSTPPGDGNEEATPVSASGTSSDTSSGAMSYLPQTGSEVVGLVALAGALVVVGGVAVTIVRRRRNSHGAE